MSARLGINCKPRLSPIGYASFLCKADFHHVFIRAWKDPTKTWHSVPYLATDDDIFEVLESWPLEWHTATGSVVEMDKFTAQRKKEETKLRMAQLVEKRRKEEAEAKA